MVRPCSFMLVVGLLVMDSSAQYDSSNEKLAVSNADKIASGVIELRKRQYHPDTLLINDNGSSTCSQIITEPGFITSPGYPGPYPPGTSCSYEIYAPECYCPQITFLSFQLSGHDPLCSGSRCCNSDYLEIITSNTMSGNVYCGTDITAGQVFTATISTLNLFFSAEKSAPGWSATVSLVPIPGCVVRNLARVADSPSPSGFTAPIITDFTVPTITDFTAPTITDFTAPTITDFTAPTITDFTAPTITDFTPPTITDFTPPNITDFTPPTITDFTPTITDFTPPTITDFTPPNITDFTPPTITEFTPPNITSTPPTATTTPPTTAVTCPSNTRTPPTTTTTTTKSTIGITSTPKSKCKLRYVNGCFHWTSPSFGKKTHYNFHECSVSGRSSTPHKVRFEAHQFQVSDHSHVSISLPYNRTITLSGNKPWSFTTPNCNFNMKFAAKGHNTGGSFNISVCPKKTPCHKIIKTSVSGTRGYEETPDFRSNKRHSELTQCEWWIEAPKGKRISVNIKTKMDESHDCTSNYACVNGRGDRKYPMETSSIYCGSGHQTVTSTDNMLCITYQGHKDQSSGMGFSYNVE